MRLYHFINEKYGLDNISRRRLKIATYPDLNDPFELFSINFSNESIRNAFKVLKEELSIKRGILCFSQHWHNPVLWSHYADRHRGICLGFDLPDDKVKRISYSRKRLLAEVDKFISPNQMSVQEMQKFLFTKYAHWKYEDEVRGFLMLEEQDPITRLYYSDFSAELNLKEVMVGACSGISRQTIQLALGDLSSSVRIKKARLAFKTFRVIEQRNKHLWE